jgi:hypothetical protein
MAVNEAKLRAIGQKFGESLSDFTQASENILEQVLMDYCNTGVELMRKEIRKKARTKGASTLAQAIINKPAKTTADSIIVPTVSQVTYYDYVDKGVKGVYNKSKAPQSKYKFKNLYTPPKMVESFKEYIARTGSKSMKGKSLIRKNKKKQANIIDEAAKQMAVATKIGGIKPMNYIEKANNPKRTKELSTAIRIALGQGIKFSIKKL